MHIWIRIWRQPVVWLLSVKSNQTTHTFLKKQITKEVSLSNKLSCDDYENYAEILQFKDKFSGSLNFHPFCFCLYIRFFVSPSVCHLLTLLPLVSFPLLLHQPVSCLTCSSSTMSLTRSCLFDMHTPTREHTNWHIHTLLKTQQLTHNQTHTHTHTHTRCSVGYSVSATVLCWEAVGGRMMSSYCGDFLLLRQRFHDNQPLHTWQTDTHNRILTGELRQEQQHADITNTDQT